MLCLLTAGCADVEEEIVHLEVLERCFFLIGNHTACAVCKAHLNVDEIAAEQTANVRESQKTIGVNIGDNNADGVHMRRKHNFAAGPASGREAFLRQMRLPSASVVTSSR